MLDLHVAVEPGIHFYYVFSQLLQRKLTWPGIVSKSLWKINMIKKVIKNANLDEILR